MNRQVKRNKKSKKSRNQSAGFSLPNPFSEAKKNISKKKKKLTRKIKKKAKSVKRDYKVSRINTKRKKKNRPRSKKLSKLDKKKESLFNISQDDFEIMSDSDLRDRDQRVDSLLDEYDEETKSAIERDKEQRKEKRMGEKIDRKIRNSGALTRISGEVDEIEDQVKSNTVRLDDLSSTVKLIEKVLEGMESFTNTRDSMATQEQEEAKQKADSAFEERIKQFDILEDRDNAPDDAALSGSDIEAEIKRIERGDASASAAESTLEGPGNVFDEPQSLGEKIRGAVPSMPPFGSSEPSMASAFAQDINQEVPTTGVEYEGLPSTPEPPGAKLERAVPPSPQGPALPDADSGADSGADEGADEGELDSLAPMRAEMGGEEQPFHAAKSQYGGRGRRYYYY